MGYAYSPGEKSKETLTIILATAATLALLTAWVFALKFFGVFNLPEDSRTVAALVLSAGGLLPGIVWWFCFRFFRARLRLPR